MVISLEATVYSLSNATGWNSESTTFYLANHFTHNPRLTSPFSFRTPPKVPSYSGDLISVDMEINSSAFDTQRSDVRTSTPNSQSPTNSSPGYRWSNIFTISGSFIFTEGSLLFTTRSNHVPRRSPALPQGRAVSPAGQPSSHRSQTSSSEGQFSTPSRQEDRGSTKPGDESGISLFSETRFNTSGENSEDENEQKSISDFSDGSSSKLNWSLSASYSSSAASISDSDRGRSLSDNSDGNLSSEVCATRRRRRRNLTLLSSSTTSQNGAQVIYSASYFRDYADDKGALTFSQCLQEVSHILAGAPVAMVTLRDQAAIRHSPIKYYDGYHQWHTNIVRGSFVQ
ncbi:uncharacterized protein LOC119731392 [Patiria miniata]|uniref:Uncharacterized protein n=1 Tax=Patiria miniata TaxID=46514 RepID=A0A914A9G2_PATMI|nr:uncharacterized protein LOC119731392 [Patiria miniata]